MKKKIAIIGTNGLPGRYGGWDQLMNNLTLNLNEDYAFYVYTSYHDSVKGLKEVNGAKLNIIRLKANGWQSVPYDIISLFDAAFKYDVLLVLGTSGCIVLPVIRLFNRKIVLNPDGAEWNRKKWSKPIQLFLRFSEKVGVKFSKHVISDNKRIQEHIQESYGRESTLIEYGGDNAKFIPLSEEIAQRYRIESGKYAFKVCRIEPENNIDLILDAFSKSDFKLILIGNWNFSKYGTMLRDKFKIYSNLLLLDPIYDQAQLDELRSNCGLYVHGHSVGGTNPSLVEAMNLGLFCVVYNVSYNVETTENSALYFRNASDLVEIINNFQKGSVESLKYKEKMLEIAQRRYYWDLITRKYADVFEKC